MSVYPYRDVCFQSRYSVSDSISRLSRSVKNNRFIERLKGGILGTVNPDKVILRNAPRPFRIYVGFLQFNGSFSEKNVATELTGRFEIPKCARVLMNIWLIVSVILFCLPYVFDISEAANVATLTLSVFLLLLWLLMLLLSYQRGKLDIEKISQTIKDAFS